MDSNGLRVFREAVYRCFTRSRDALMNVCDALRSETTAHAFVELSPSPFFHRRGPSLYEAFQDGRLDRPELRRVIAASAPPPPEGKRWVLGIDASSIARPASPTARDRSSQ